MDWLAGNSIFTTGKVATIFMVVIEYTWLLSVPAVMKSNRYQILYSYAASHYMRTVTETNKFSAYKSYAEHISGAFTHPALIIRIMTLE
jgi:hypothetical protein